MRYRKKPVVVDAFQYDGDLMRSNGEWSCPDWAKDAFQSGTLYYDSPSGEEPPTELYIDTLEGKHHVSVGDYIILGVAGELYPCKPDIFAQKLREADSLYAILSGCTKEPYVYCDPETMDDAILLFTDEEGAKVGAQKLAEQQIPVGIAKVDRKSLLLFYTSLYTMGVNAIQVHVGEEQKMIQLTEFVRRKDPEESKNGKVWVENPELHLPRHTGELFGHGKGL